MKLNYTVNSCVRDNFTVRAKVSNREVDATIPGLVVEMVSEDEAMGHTYRFVPEDLEKAEAEYQPGAIVEVSFKVTAPPAKRKK